MRQRMRNNNWHCFDDIRLWLKFEDIHPCKEKRNKVCKIAPCIMENSRFFYWNETHLGYNLNNEAIEHKRLYFTKQRMNEGHFCWFCNSTLNFERLIAICPWPIVIHHDILMHNFQSIFLLFSTLMILGFSYISPNINLSNVG